MIFLEISFQKDFIWKIDPLHVFEQNFEFFRNIVKRDFFGKIEPQASLARTVPEPVLNKSLPLPPGPSSESPQRARKRRVHICIICPSRIAQQKVQAGTTFESTWGLP